MEVDYNFDDVTDRCDKEACPPVNCASPYIPLGECCPVCPPQEVVYEERRGSTSAQGPPGAPGPDGRPGAPGPPGPQPDLGPIMGQIEQQAGEKGPSPDPFSYMQAQVGPVGPRGSPGEISSHCLSLQPQPSQLSLSRCPRPPRAPGFHGTSGRLRRPGWPRASWTTRQAWTARPDGQRRRAWS